LNQTCSKYLDRKYQQIFLLGMNLLRGFIPSVIITRLSDSRMPVSAEAEKALPRFVESLKNDQNFQNQLHQVADIESLRQVVQSVDPSLTGAALIPLDQATRPPKILVDSGVIDPSLPWRLLRCTGGPLVLQLICSKANFAIWIESC